MIKMIDFNEELRKFKPVLEVEELEEDAMATDVKDMLELLQYLSAKVAVPESEKE